MISIHDVQEGNEYNDFSPTIVRWREILVDPHFLRWALCYFWNLLEITAATKERTVEEMQKFVKYAALEQIEFIQNNEFIADLNTKCQLNDNGFIQIIRNHDISNCKKFGALMDEKGVNGVVELEGDVFTVFY